MAPPRIRRRHVPLRTLAGLLVAIVLLVGFSGCIADALILGSNRLRIEPAGLRREELRVGGSRRRSADARRSPVNNASGACTSR